MCITEILSVQFSGEFGTNFSIQLLTKDLNKTSVHLKYSKIDLVQ